MNTYLAINSIGLIMNLLGVLLIFLFGFRARSINVNPNTPAGENAYFVCKLGLLLLLLGFILQLASNFIR